MHTEIARQIRIGVKYGQAWSEAAKDGVPPRELTRSVTEWRTTVGKLSRKSFEVTLRRNGVTRVDGMYYWLLRKQDSNGE